MSILSPTKSLLIALPIGILLTDSDTCSEMSASVVAIGIVWILFLAIQWLISKIKGRLAKGRLSSVGSAENRLCPYCGEEINTTALLCRYCRSSLTPIQDALVAAAVLCTISIAILHVCDAIDNALNINSDLSSISNAIEGLPH